MRRSLRGCRCRRRLTRRGCIAAGSTRSASRTRRSRNCAFEQGTDRLEDEARRRAIEGYDEETYDGKGDLVRRVRKFSDRHLELLLRARRPRVFGNSAQVDLTANVRGKVELSGEGRTSLTDVLRLAGEFGVLDQMGLRLAQVVDGEAEEVAPLGLPGGEAA